MNPLEKIIIDKITKEGPITFETFMDMALYYPDLGYYSSPEAAIGREGDFYTSPHLHPVFGAMIGQQLLEMWEAMDKPAEFQVIEMGAGHGYLAKDIFDYLITSGHTADFLDSSFFVIVEPYAHFEAKQRTLLDPLCNHLFSILNSRGKTQKPVSWVKSLKDVKEVTGCIFSNELLDAFPVHLIKMEDSLKEIYINLSGSSFIEEYHQVSSRDITDYVNRIPVSIAPEYRSEVNLKIKDWLAEVSAAIAHGFVLTVDYGYSAKEYYSDDRTEGTLLCYHKHTVHQNPYQNIGTQDITAHVNFSSLKLWGEELGLNTIGYCPQGTYLTASGIDEVIVERYADSPDYLSEISKIKGLIFPQGMGDSHNVMIQYKGAGSPELRGFSMRNQVGNL
jgi:SAM-dependent MidA family methyltransferase